MDIRYDPLTICLDNAGRCRALVTAGHISPGVSWLVLGVTGAVCHCYGLSLVWSVTAMVCHWCGLLLVWSVTGVVCHWCDLSLL